MEAQKESQPKSKLFWALVIGAFILFIILLITKRETLLDTYDVLRKVELQYLLLLPIIQIVNYFFVGNYYRTMFGRFGVKISIFRAWGVVSAMNFVNQVLPSGGLSGISYLAYGLRANISSGKTTLVQIGRYVGAFGSYFLMVPIIIILLIQEGNARIVESLLANVGHNVIATVTVILFLLFCALLYVGAKSRYYSHKFSGVIVNTVNGLVRPFRGDKSDLITEEMVTGTVDEFHEGLAFFKNERSRAIIPILSMVMSTIMEMSIVYVSLRAVSVQVDLSVVFVAFAAANIAGVVSVIPGDVGVHEAVVIAVLSAFNIPIEVAISATLLYRVFNKMIFLPIGFYFYTNFLQPPKQQTGMADAE